MGAPGVSFFAAGLEPARRYRLLPYYFALGLHRCHATRRLVEKWARGAEAEARVHEWLHTLAVLPLSFRPPLARWLERSGEIAKPVPAGLADVLRTAAAMHSPRFVSGYIADIARELRRGSPVPFILNWLEMRRLPGTYAGLPKVTPGAEFPVSRVRELIEGADRCDLSRAMQETFYACLEWPCAAALLMRPEWESLALDERLAAINLMDRGGEAAAAFLTELAAMTPESRAAFVKDVYYRASHGLSAGGAEGTRTLLRRWDGDAATFIELANWVEEFPARLRPALLAITQPAARQLAKAGRGLAAELRFSGCRSLVEADADRTLAWLALAPAHFIHTCVWLGAHGRVRASRLLRRASRLALFGAPPQAPPAAAADSLVRLDCLLAAHAPLARRLPEFATWDKHFSGVKVLKTVAIEDVARRLVAQLPLLRMWWLQAEIKRELALHTEEHATLFGATLVDNRRPLTRFLRDHSAKRDDRRLDHPANRRWLARRHDQFNLEAWLDPVTIQAGDGLTLGIERDPLEILKIGSYVGSCLALGGMNAHAAVAILLDANKRVIFARNSRGRFVARQVVAISDDGMLVCYAVYPRRTPAEIEDAFERYVTQWSTQLGLPLAKGDAYEASERVTPLTVKHWYDDGLWSRFCA